MVGTDAQVDVTVGDSLEEIVLEVSISFLIQFSYYLEGSTKEFKYKLSELHCIGSDNSSPLPLLLLNINRRLMDVFVKVLVTVA